MSYLGLISMFRQNPEAEMSGVTQWRN